MSFLVFDFVLFLSHSEGNILEDWNLQHHSRNMKGHAPHARGSCSSFYLLHFQARTWDTFKQPEKIGTGEIWGAVIPILKGTHKDMLKMGLCLKLAMRIGAVGTKNPWGEEVGACKSRMISLWTFTSTASWAAAHRAELSRSITGILCTECVDGNPPWVPSVISLHHNLDIWWNSRQIRHFQEIYVCWLLLSGFFFFSFWKESLQFHSTEVQYFLILCNYFCFVLLLPFNLSLAYLIPYFGLCSCSTCFGFKPVLYFTSSWNPMFG